MPHDNPYDPNGIGRPNGNFLGLPHAEDPRVEFIAVPFEATVSYGGGTGGGPANVLRASAQLDVCLPDVPEPWTLGFRWTELSGTWSRESAALRAAAEAVIAARESDVELSGSEREGLDRVDAAGAALAADLCGRVGESLANGRFPVVIGGEHAVSLGAFRAAAATGSEFGILQLDAHMDLRAAYEGFTYSHASVMYNALRLAPLARLVQVGIRDWAPAEAQLAEASGGRVRTFYDHELKADQLSGKAFAKTCERIVAELPQRVWISFDIDALNPSLCMHTGTPVPGGLSFAEASLLCASVSESGREVIGLDVVEVAGEPYEYEGAVAARLAYRIAARSAYTRARAEKSVPTK